jgi:hypothetical protein
MFIQEILNIVTLITCILCSVCWSSSDFNDVEAISKFVVIGIVVSYLVINVNNYLITRNIVDINIIFTGFLILTIILCIDIFTKIKYQIYQNAKTIEFMTKLFNGCH